MNFYGQNYGRKTPFETAYDIFTIAFTSCRFYAIAATKHSTKYKENTRPLMTYRLEV